MEDYELSFDNFLDDILEALDMKRSKLSHITRFDLNRIVSQYDDALSDILQERYDAGYDDGLEDGKGLGNDPEWD